MMMRVFVITLLFFSFSLKAKGQIYSTYLDSAKVLSEQRYFKSAIDLCSKAIDLEPDSSRAYFYRAGFHVALIAKRNASSDYDHYKSAISDYSKVLELDSINTQALFFRGGAHSNMGFLNSAKEDYEAAIYIDDNQPKVHNSLAVIYARQRNTTVALKHINKAIELAPDYAKAYSNRGNIYDMVGQKTKACENWQKAIELGYQANSGRYSRWCK